MMKFAGVLLGLYSLVTPCAGAPFVRVSRTPLGEPAVGTPITWMVVGSDSQPGVIDYRFSAGPAGGALRVVRDYSTDPQFAWAVTSAEGTYVMQVTARNTATGKSVTSSQPFEMRSNLNGASAVVSATGNALVALYSAPACPAGQQVVVLVTGGDGAFDTDPEACSGTSSVNILVGGLLPETTYQMQAIVLPDTPRPGPVQSYTTGPLDSTLAFPGISIEKAAGSNAATSQGLIMLDFLSHLGGPYYAPTAVDLQGRPVWYYAPRAAPEQVSGYFFRPLAGTGGHVILTLADPASTLVKGQILREADLAGNTVRETNATRVSEQLSALGQLGIVDFDHDAIPLPNGHMLVLCSQERIFPSGTQGAVSDVDIIGNAIVDLNEDWQVTWAWSGFDHLDINRAAVLGETCTNTPGCPPLTLAAFANDWMHGNSLNYIPQDGSVLLSVRHQDWVIKIDYANGLGTGDVVWRLGADGDFTIASTDAYPWFSHQHDVEFELGGTSILSMFDNGDTRVARNPGVVEHSRGYVLAVDETARTASPVMLADLGVYSLAVGSAERLENGDYYFEAGLLPTAQPGAFMALSIEVAPDGSQVFALQDLCQTYRGYRMHSVYSRATPRMPAATPRLCDPKICR